jgi:hypothetical protein
MICRELGVQHIEEIELRGPAADAIAKHRDRAEKLGRLESLSLFTGKIPIGKLAHDYFATHPTRSVRMKRDGTLVDTFIVVELITDAAEQKVPIRRVIPRPIDAAPLNPSKLPPLGDWHPPQHIRWSLAAARDGKVSVLWWDSQARTLAPAPDGCPWAEFSPPPPRRRSVGDLVLIKETDSNGVVTETWADSRTGQECRMLARKMADGGDGGR